MRKSVVIIGPGGGDIGSVIAKPSPEEGLAICVAS